ncbi:RNA polymerase sigma factor [Dyella mobilis]|uniref:RNA polymerase sigma factor n=1 Tax=Dyella mobilis TaxID=1849582 RepID=A0ABS2KEL6_9GAMM|nr:RNA polymerase sigma factor [Dyella mobilis]MBM7129587.1 RNA polymerase sigma factor [Dyella mobilis]GLQ98149.1 ECF sigma factor [Dyella mobilis]
MREKHATWSALFAEKRATLSSYFLRRVAHRWDAQDLVQEVYLRLLRMEPADAANILSPEAYLFTVAANLVKEHAVLRQQQPLGSDELEHVVEHLVAPSNVEADVDSESRRRHLASLMERLPPKCRAVMVMHYRDELSYREIAERMSISTNMVKKYIVKGLAACRQRMADYE